MARILCTGIATLDIVNQVSRYPREDDEVRILSQEKRRGGNATNTAVILSQLGHQCSWAGTLVNSLAEQSEQQIILNDLKHHQINYDHCFFFEQGKIPTSYITLSQETGSRTICHYRDLPELPFQAFKNFNLSSFDWLHFEGRNVEHTRQMMAYSKAQYPDTPISLEIEKNRNDIETLIAYADVVLFSRHFARQQQYQDARTLCLEIGGQYPDKVIICAWGESGAGAALAGKFFWQAGEKVQVVDSLGAGDVFNAAIIDQQHRHNSLQKSLHYACSLAAEKCTRKGFHLINS